MSIPRLAHFALVVFLGSALLAPAHATSWTWMSLVDEASRATQAGQLQKAEDGFRKALEEARRSCGEECRATMLTLNFLAQVVVGRGRAREGEELYRRALAIVEKHEGPEHELTGQVLGNVGFALVQQGKVGDGEALFRRGMAIVEKAKGPDDLTFAAMVTTGAMLHSNRGHLAEAERDARRAVGILDRTGKLDSIQAPVVLSNLGAVLLQQLNQKEAEQHFRRALKIIEDERGREHPDAPLYLTNIGSALEAQGQHAEAVAHFRRALAVSEKARGPESDVTLTCLGALAQGLLRHGKPDEAEPLFRRAHALSIRVRGEQHHMTAAVLNGLGVALEQRNLHVEAESNLRAAVAIARGSAVLEDLMRFSRDLGYFLALHGKAGEALPYYREALQILDQLFSQTRGLREEARQGFLARYSHYYREAIELLLRLHAGAPGSGHDREALAVASRDQSRIFTELLRQADVAKFATEPQFLALQQARDALRDQVAALRASMAKAPTTGSDAAALRSNLALELKKVEPEMRAVQERLASTYPRFAELVQPRGVTVTELQERLLRPDEALLVYVLLPRQAAVFAVTKQRFTLVVRPIGRDSITTTVRAIRRSLEQVGAGDTLLALRKLDPATLHLLYTELIAPVEEVLKGATKVLVVGDGPLNTLPLESLVVRYGDGERQAFQSAAAGADGSAANPLLAEYARLPYLAERYRFAYLPSLSALVSQRLHLAAPPAYDQQLVSFADPVFSAMEDRTATDHSAATRAVLSMIGRSVGGERGKAPILARLQDTADEAREIAAVVGGKHTLLLREKAQERVAKSTDLSRTRYLHFATHGFLGGDFLAIKESMDEERGGFFSRRGGRTPDSGAEPAQPALALTLVGDLQGEDGFLTVKDVMESFNLNAELVVLSACNTAGEQEAAFNGEGFAGLTRAFMYAGARAMVVSHWSVESQSAKLTITEAFRELKGGKSALAALDVARQKLRVGTFAAGTRTVSRAHPYFWAPFVYVGD